MDVRETLASLAEDFGAQADMVDIAAREAKASAQTYRQCASAARLALRAVDEPAGLVFDDAARKRAYAVALDPVTGLTGNWSGGSDIRRLVDLILAAAAGTGEESRG